MKGSRLVICLLVAALVVMTQACQKKAPPELDNQAPKRPQASASAPAAGLKDAENMFIKVSREVMPAVVNIRTFQNVPDEDLMFAPGRMPDDEYHHKGTKKRPHSEPSFGSGVIISEDGYIITNAHVVKDASEINVKLTDKREFAAKLIGSDVKTDLAVLKIEGKEPFPKAALGDSSKLEIGQWAIAIGNPFGLERTLTVGVVSGVGRADVGVAQYENFIQTDASINPGNSGGPLLNSGGEVIGINTAIMSAGQGISFAIPINMVKDVSKSLIEKGKVVRGWLGVGIQTLTPELAEGLGAGSRTGVLVNKIYRNSPSEKAGFRVKDVIVEFDGVATEEARQLQAAVAGTKVGKTVDVKLMRDGREKVVKVGIEEMSDFEVKEKQRIEERSESSPMLGITVHPSESNMQGFEFKGVVVVDIDAGSGAEKAGVQMGDVITYIGREKIEKLEDFRRAADRLKDHDTTVLMVMRAGSPLFIALKAGQ